MFFLLLGKSIDASDVPDFLLVWVHKLIVFFFLYKSLLATNFALQEGCPILKIAR
jgi:hypothetical protein